MEAPVSLTYSSASQPQCKLNILSGIFQLLSTTNTSLLLLDDFIDLVLLIINKYQMDKTGHVLSDPALDKCAVIPPNFGFISHYNV